MGKRISTTEDLIKVSQKWWGDKLDYSLTEFTGALNKVRFICKSHGEFLQVASNHVQGSQGCSSCRAEKVRDDFIRKATKAWGTGMFDYSDVVPGSFSVKVLIRCMRHGTTFEQTKRAHLNMNVGCPECRGVLVTRSFTDQATKVWGDRWDYSNSQCFGVNDHVTIGCPEHGEFTQLASTHLAKKVGCPECSRTKRLTQEDFLRRVEEKWGDRWDMSKANYVNNGTKVVIGCKLHGDFKQRPMSLFVGKVGCPKCNGKDLSHSDFLQRSQKTWGDRWDYSNSHYKDIGSKVSISCKEHGEFSQISESHMNGYVGCPSCKAIQTSRAEFELIEFIRSLGVEAEHRFVGLLSDSRREVDVYVPKSRVAFEFNGLYYHSEKFRKPEDHFRKVAQAGERGVSLFHIWEDDWRDKLPIVQEHIRQILGLSTLPKISARSTDISSSLSSFEARTFLDKYHIQGYTGGSVVLGLRHREELVAVAVFKRRSSEEYELVRYATSANVRGGHSKLVHHFEKTHSYQKLVTFADLSFSSGDLYRKTGWVEDGTLPPDYMYIYRGRRVHKFNFRKARFETDPSLQHQPEMTEWQLAQINGILRIYDAGKIRFIKPHPSLSTSSCQREDTLV